MPGFFRRRRHRRLRSLPFPADWLAIVERNARFFLAMEEPQRTRLLGDMQVFLAEKNFEGCNGLELTDEIKVTIAAHACRLIAGHETDVFPRLVTVLVYPSAYVAESVEPLGGGVYLRGQQVRLGEAWKDGVAVVSWSDVLAGIDGETPGHNLVAHEFAHILDMEDGAADGTPILGARGAYASWSATLELEYERLRRDAALGRYSTLESYGATDPSEFFAVATEAFFEKTSVLRRRHPALYRELRSFYAYDPAPRRFIVTAEGDRVDVGGDAAGGSDDGGMGTS